MTSRTDSDIKRSIEAELRRCLSVHETHIAVKVIGGAVTLTGRVAKHFHRYEAEDAVKRVEGITAIANDVRVWHVIRGELSDPEVRRGGITTPQRRGDAGSAN
jgi:osmotically-inducible protein OsmY